MTRFSTTAILAFAAALVLLLALAHTSSVKLTAAVALLTPAGAGAAALFRRWFAGLIDDAHLTCACLTACSVLAVPAALFESSGRPTAAGAFVALTTGALAGTLLRGCSLPDRPAWLLPALAVGAGTGVVAFIFLGPGAILLLTAALTLHSAAAVTVSSAVAEQAPARSRELVHLG